MPYEPYDDRYDPEAEWEDELGKQIYNSLLGPDNLDNPFAEWNEDDPEEEERYEPEE